MRYDRNSSCILVSVPCSSRNFILSYAASANSPSVEKRQENSKEEGRGCLKSRDALRKKKKRKKRIEKKNVLDDKSIPSERVARP